MSVLSASRSKGAHYPQTHCSHASARSTCRFRFVSVSNGKCAHDRHRHAQPNTGQNSQRARVAARRGPPRVLPAPGHRRQGDQRLPRAGCSGRGEHPDRLPGRRHRPGDARRAGRRRLRCRASWKCPVRRGRT